MKLCLVRQWKSYVYKHTRKSTINVLYYKLLPESENLARRKVNSHIWLYSVISWHIMSRIHEERKDFYSSSREGVLTSTSSIRSIVAPPKTMDKEKVEKPLFSQPAFGKFSKNQHSYNKISTDTFVMKFVFSKHKLAHFRNEGL